MSKVCPYLWFFFSRCFTALGRTNICFSGESPIYDNWRWFWKFFELNFACSEVFPQELTVHPEFPLMTFDRAVNPSWLWCMISHYRSCSNPVIFTHAQEHLPISYCVFCSQTKSLGQAVSSTKEEGGDFPHQYLPSACFWDCHGTFSWHRVLVTRAPSALCWSGTTPPTAAALLLPFKRRNFAKVSVSASCRMKSKRIIVKRKTFIITSATIFLCVNFFLSFFFLS